MKLRIKGNSLRLRLTQSEIKNFINCGSISNILEVGPHIKNCLKYGLLISTTQTQIEARFLENEICICLPEALAQNWAQTSQVSIEYIQKIEAEKELKILIEKDFACLKKRPGEDDSDAFPNPQAT